MLKCTEESHFDCGLMHWRVGGLIRLEWFSTEHSLSCATCSVLCVFLLEGVEFGEVYCVRLVLYCVGVELLSMPLLGVG